MEITPFFLKMGTKSQLAILRKMEYPAPNWYIENVFLQNAENKIDTLYHILFLITSAETIFLCLFSFHYFSISLRFGTHFPHKLLI